MIIILPLYYPAVQSNLPLLSSHEALSRRPDGVLKLLYLASIAYLLYGVFNQDLVMGLSSFYFSVFEFGYFQTENIKDDLLFVTNASYKQLATESQNDMKSYKLHINVCVLMRQLRKG